MNIKPKSRFQLFGHFNDELIVIQLFTRFHNSNNCRFDLVASILVNFFYDFVRISIGVALFWLNVILSNL